MVELRSGDVVVVVDPPAGGLVTRIAVGESELLTPQGMFVMAPWAGRWRGHPIHGTVRGVAWSVDDADASTAVLSATLGPGWPWPGRCTHELAVHDDHLDLRATVHGDGFDAVVGWHPWFTKPRSVELDAESMLERGDDQLPTGRRVEPVRPGDRPLDDCFEGVRWPATLRYDRLTVSLSSTCGDAVLFDALPHTTCVEPQTGPPNALHTGEAHAAPLEAKMTLAWS